MSILDALSKHSMFSETLDTLNRDPSTGHQMKGYDFAQNFPGAVPGGVYTPTSFLGPMLSKGYQYGQEIGKSILDGPGGITIGDALSKAKTQSDANIQGMLGEGFDMNTYNQNVKDFNIDDVTFANSFGIPTLKNNFANIGKTISDAIISPLNAYEPMDIEEIIANRTQDIPELPIASVPSNFLNYQFRNARTPFTPIREGITTLTDKLGNLKDRGLDFIGSGKELALKGLGSLFGPIGSFVGSALSNIKESPTDKVGLDNFGGNYDPYGYKSDLTAGNLGARQDPFGRNISSFAGNYYENRMKEVARLSKLKELSKFQQDLLDYGKNYLDKVNKARIEKANIEATPGFDVSGGAGGSYDRSFDYGANTREAQDRRSSDLGFSDIRLKENIELVGKSPSNINIYKFNYKNNPITYQGVMAHEVPWANVKHSNGYMMVDYNKIDVKFKKWQR